MSDYDYERVMARARSMQLARTAEMAKDEVYLAGADLEGHRILYKPSQVERCLSCYGIKIEVGLRLAMLMPNTEFVAGNVPNSRFYVGTVVRIWGSPDDPLMTIEWDGGPGRSTSIVCGVKQYERFCIPVPKRFESKPKPKPRIKYRDWRP